MSNICSRKCYWNFNNQCVSESLEELIEDASFSTCNCEGWLRPNFEEYFYNTYKECKVLLDRMNVKDLENVRDFMEEIVDNRIKKSIK